MTVTATAPDSSASEVARGLLGFNQQVIDQALALLGHFGCMGQAAKPLLNGPVDAHLRHIVEHYAALVFPAKSGVVNYDARPRERALESDPLLASSRLHEVRERLATWPAALLGTPVCVRGQGGLLGDSRFEVAYSLGRELAFVASHAIHHFAALAPHACALGVTLPRDFGQAPSTVAHDRTVVVTSYPTNNPEPEETPCIALHQSA